MKKLMLVSEYRDTAFTNNSRPSINTIKRWIRDGELAGRRIGGNYYVEVDQHIPNVHNDQVSNILRSL